MSKKKLYFKILFSIFILTLTCKIFGQLNINKSITIIQESSSVTIIKPSDTITLERLPFSIKYYCKQYDSKNDKFYAAQIAITENPSDTLQIKIGKATKDISFFEPGTGMAPGENGMYDTMYITNTGHHYLTYENEENKRVQLISKNEDEMELEWKITAAFFQEKDVQFSELKLSNLYFIIFIDRNLNQSIDKDEVKIVNVHFM